MSITKLHTGEVKGGKFIPDDPASFKQAFYGHERKRVQVTVRRFRKSSSNKQKRYLWGIIYKLISDYTGDSPEEVHEMMKWQFLRVRRDSLPDKVKSLRELNTKEQEDYHEELRRWAAIEINVYIPEPNQVEF